MQKNKNKSKVKFHNGIEIFHNLYLYRPFGHFHILLYEEIIFAMPKGKND